MATHFLSDADPRGRMFHGLLDEAFMHMAPPDLPAAGVHRQAFGWKHALPDPLPSQPFLDASTFTKLGQKDLDIVPRTIAQSLPWQKITVSLFSFDIKGRPVRPYPVTLHAGHKHVPKPLSRCELFWTFFSHKTHPIQIVTLQLTVP